MDKSTEEYKRALNEANKKYGTKSNIFRSSYIVKKYKDFGGEFKNNKNIELTRWYKELWINVIELLENNKILACGIGNNEGCRPIIRVDENTPITIPELLKIHTKKNILKMAYLKKENPNIKVNWKDLTYN